ncbi:MAG TPA: membrane-bound lytic murein transglycosylase MltF [Verrucomicrobiae bacterium]|nr:membrane-bound lytic murein transglycosylase MltF [Verrucomicrobiae bacterium]
MKPPSSSAFLPRRAFTGLALTGALGLLGSLTTCSPQVPLMTRVDSLGVLRVATFNSPTTYYVGAAGPMGFEYDLSRAFAHDLGLEVEILVAESPSEVLDLVRAGRAHVGAGISVTPATEKIARFTPPLRSTALQLVYRAGRPKPKTLYELDAPLVITADSTAAQTLRELTRINPKLVWQETEDFGAEELLFRVANGDADYTIAPSDLVAINQRYYPQLRVAFTLTDFQNVAWAFAPGDESLSGRADAFLHKLDPRVLAQVRDRYFGHVSRVGHYGAIALATHSETRLPRYRKAFEDAARRHGLDWRLLAAVGYQESMWDPAAVSPTGVRGLMQITTDTADFLNIRDRLDPTQSIYGAARYLQQIHAKLPPDITEPDRTWMTLAAYNVGYGHLLDARDVTAMQGGDPNRWVEVRNNLPLLTQSRWHRKTRYGYARGHEAVTYVGNIRSYYDMLSWITGGKAPAEAPEAPLEPGSSKREKQSEPLNINSPVL